MGGSLKKCVQCGKDNSARCSGCFVAHYCSADCQKLGWKKHKTECKETRAKYKVATFGQGFLALLNNQSKTHRYTVDDPDQPTEIPTGQFVVKVQVPLAEGKGFFPAICKKDSAEVNGYKLEINPEKMLPVETW